MSFNTFTNMKPKPDHIDRVLVVLKDSDLLTLEQLRASSGLSLTQVKCALNHLEKIGKIKVKRQNQTPRVLIAINS